MNRANLPAAPTQWSAVAPTGTTTIYMTGLTIREHFASLALQGVLVGSAITPTKKDLTGQEALALMAKMAVASADALIAVLAKARP